MRVLMILCMMLLQGQAHAHSPKAHKHGASELEITIEGNRVQIRLQSPMEDLVGFERKPRNDRERDLIKSMNAQLANGARLFVLPAAAGCVLKAHESSAPILDQKAVSRDSDHADVSADWAFECAAPKAVKSITVNLFDDFTRMKSIKTQLVAPDAQRGTNLTAGKRQLVW